MNARSITYYDRRGRVHTRATDTTSLAREVAGLRAQGATVAKVARIAKVG